MHGDRRTIGLFVALGIACAAIAAGARHRGHHGDVAVFRDWYLATCHEGRGEYLDHHADVNYGGAGLAVVMLSGLASGGSCAHPPSLGAFHVAHKLTLAAWTLLAAIAFASLLRALRIETFRRWTAAFAVWPCTFVGGLYFGQIDVVVLLAQLASLAVATCAIAEPECSPPIRRLRLATVGALAAFALALKPLALFSTPSLLAMAIPVIASVRHREGTRSAAGDALALTFGAALVAFLPDLIFATPAGHGFHLWHVFRWAGPPHGRMIGNGAGVWVFLGRAPDASSNEPFAGTLTPHAAGVLAFLIAEVALTLACFGRPRALRTLPAAAFVVHAGASQLAMSLFLAGTHERYAFLAWGPLLAGLLAMRARAALVPLAIAGTLQGLFVLSTIEWHAFDAVPMFRSTRLATEVTLVAFGAVLLAASAARRPETSTAAPASIPSATPPMFES